MNIPTCSETIVWMKYPECIPELDGGVAYLCHYKKDKFVMDIFWPQWGFSRTPLKTKASKLIAVADLPEGFQASR